MNFYLNLSPHFWGNLTSFVPVMAKNTCVCGCRIMLYYSKVNISLFRRFMKPKIGIMDTFLAHLTNFYQANPSFGGKPTSSVAVLAQNTCVYGRRLVLYHLNFNIISLSRFMKPGMGIIVWFLLQPHQFLSNQSPFWRKIVKFFLLFCPKTHVSVVVD